MSRYNMYKQKLRFFINILFPIFLGINVLILVSCDIIKRRHQSNPTPTSPVGPQPSVDQTANPIVVPTIETTVVSPVEPTMIPTIFPILTPTTVPVASPTPPREFKRVDIGLRLAPGIVFPIAGTGCDAIKLPSGVVVSEYTCVQELIKSASLPLGIFWQGTWVGSLEQKISTDPKSQIFSFLRANSAPGIIQFNANFNIMVPVANVVTFAKIETQVADLRAENLFLFDDLGSIKALLNYIGAGTPRRRSQISNCKYIPGKEPCALFEILIYDQKAKGKIGDLIVFKSKEEGYQAVGFITGTLFNEKKRNEHGFKPVPWIVELF